MSQPARARSPWLTLLAMAALVLGGPCGCVVLANLTTEGSPYALLVAFCVPSLGLALGLLAWQGIGFVRGLLGWVRLFFVRRSRSPQQEFGGRSVPPGMIFLLIFPLIVGVGGGALISWITLQPLMISIALYGILGLLYGLVVYLLSRAGIIFGADWWTLTP